MLKITKMRVQKFLTFVVFYNARTNVFKSANFFLLFFYIVKKDALSSDRAAQFKVEIEDGL